MAKKDEYNISGPVVVALGPGEEGAALIEAASAISKGGGRALECLTVEEGRALSAEAAARLTANKDLARSLGARVSSASDVDVAEAIFQDAKAWSASAVIVGSPSLGLRRGGIARKLMSAARDFAVISVAPPGRVRAGGRRGRYLGGDDSPSHYAAAFAIIALCTFANLALASYAGYWAAAILYLAAISLGAIWLGFGPVLLAAILSAVAWDFLFIPPRFTMTIHRPADALMLGLYLLVSLCSGLMTSRLRASESLLREERRKLSRMNALTLSLASVGSPAMMLSKGLGWIAEETKCEAIAILKESDSGLRKQAESGWEPLDEDARTAAASCFAEGKSAGRFTDIVPACEWHFLPLESAKGRLGVIGLRAPHDADWDETVESYARTSVSTIALALARENA